MNERIRELAEQAGFRSNPDIYDRNQSFDIPKFAELIVRECVSLANEEANHLEDECELGRADDLRRWGRVMLQHFGVEE
jgi:hypothetical protein